MENFFLIKQIRLFEIIYYLKGNYLFIRKEREREIIVIVKYSKSGAHRQLGSDQKIKRRKNERRIRSLEL